MDYMNQNIAINLKTIRQAKGYSLDVVSEQFCIDIIMHMRYT